MHRIPVIVAGGMGLLAGALSLLPTPCAAAVNDPVGIYTYHGDTMRTGWNSHETQLTHATVTVGPFGKLWTHTVDGQVYAQPLVAPGINLGAAGTHNLVFVVTEHNTVYAFDADAGGDPIWQISLGPSVPNSPKGVPCNDIGGPEYGITSTPVNDPATGTLYVVAKTLEGAIQHYRLHALDITNGHERSGWPAEILGSVPGTGGGSSNGQVAFNPRIENQRIGLLLLNGRVLIGFSSHCDMSLNLYHGWIFSFNAADPTQLPAIFNSTPDRVSGSNESAGGIWQAGFGLAADAAGNVYFETGNGTFNADQGGRNVGDSFVKLTTTGGTLTFTNSPANFYTPNSQVLLDMYDLDLGSGGAMVIPDQTGTTTPHLLVGSGKDGIIRLLNRDNLGGHTGRQYPQLSENTLQNVPNPSPFDNGSVYGGPAYWEGPNGHYVFFTSAFHPMFRYRLGTNPNGNGASWLTPDARSTTSFGAASLPEPQKSTPTPVLSSSGLTAGTGIVWLLCQDDNTLRAYNAENLSLLWQSKQGTGNGLDGPVVKFTLPIVANGKVYAGTKTSIVCYGLKPGV